MLFFFAGTSESTIIGKKRCKTMLAIVQSAVQCTVTLSNPCIKACIGFASKLAEPSNGFLRALLKIPLTPQQGVDLSFW